MKNKSNPEWDRIAIVIKYSGEKSINGFSSRLGLRRAENLYQIKKGNHGISVNLAKTINAMFPMFSVSWLLLGEKDETENKLRMNHYKLIYPCDDRVGLELGFTEKETGSDFIPELTIQPAVIIQIRFALIKENSEINLKCASGTDSQFSDQRNILFQE